MKNFLGQDGFIWWIGVVEDIDDPLKLGRCRVRIFGYHPPKKDKAVNRDDLPWALSIHPLNTPNLYASPNVGDWVFGFFMDAMTAQEPAILGYIPGIPVESQEFFGEEPVRDSANKLMRTFKTLSSYTEVDPGFNLKNTIFWESRNKTPSQHGHFVLFYDEPGFETLFLKSSKGHSLRFNHDPAYNQVVMASNGGHSIELTDNSGAETITIKHKIGTKITIDKDGKITIDTDNDLDINAKNINFNVDETFQVNADSISLTGTTLTIADASNSYTPTSLKQEQEAQDDEIEIAKTLPVSGP